MKDKMAQLGYDLKQHQARLDEHKVRYNKVSNVGTTQYNQEVTLIQRKPESDNLKPPKARDPPPYSLHSKGAAPAKSPRPPASANKNSKPSPYSRPITPNKNMKSPLKGRPVVKSHGHKR